MLNINNAQVNYIKVNENRINQRLDNFLICLLKNLPKSHIYKIIRSGEVRINKSRSKCYYKIKLNDEIRIPPLKLTNIIKNNEIPDIIIKNIKKNILYEDKNLLIVNKPSGLSVHDGSKCKYNLIDILRKIYIENNLELVHRLDKYTSGCILISKNFDTLKYLHYLLKNHKIYKTYHALLLNSSKILNNDKITINSPILKNNNTGTVKIDIMGKPSITKFNRIKSFKQYTLAEVTPITGRTHQIRIHALSMNSPVLGDIKYGNFIENKRIKKMGLNRIFLHAKQLKFKMKDKKNDILVDASYDDKLKLLLSKLE